MEAFTLLVLAIAIATQSISLGLLSREVKNLTAYIAQRDAQCFRDAVERELHKPPNG